MTIGDWFRRLMRRRPDVDADDFDSGVNVKFRQLDSGGLKQIAVVAQCLDNQWVPGDLLRRMLAKRLSFDDAAVAEARITDARAEYLRALLNAEQVVINRAFFFNNPVVYDDFLEASPARETFKKLLDSSVIVPFLYSERSPGEATVFGRDKAGWAAWKRLLPDTEPSCVRLSWDDDENRVATSEHLHRRFATFLDGVRHLNPDGLRHELSVPADQLDRFLARLREVAAWAVNQDNVTRDAFYKRFIVVDEKDANPARGRYDGRKPFAAELKQLIDLRYNVNLPDALDRFPITPIESLNRTALQEFPRPRGDLTEPGDLARRLLQRHAFAHIQGSLSIPLTGLDLTHVWQARHTDEWHAYIRDLQALIDAPEEFAERAPAVYSSYVALARTLAQSVGERAVPWLPTAEIVIEVLGSAIAIVLGDNPVATVVGQVASTIATKSSTAVIRYVVRDHNRQVARHQLATGVELMRVRFERTGRDWDTLIAELERQGRMTVGRLDRVGADDPTIDGREPADVGT